MVPPLLSSSPMAGLFRGFLVSRVTSRVFLTGLWVPCRARATPVCCCVLRVCFRVRMVPVRVQRALVIRA